MSIAFKTSMSSPSERKHILFDNRSREYPYLQFCEGPLLDPDGMQQLTFGAWFKDLCITESNEATICGWGEDAGWGQIKMTCITNPSSQPKHQIYARIGSYSTTTDVSLDPDSWNLVVMRYNSPVCNIFFNNNQISQFTASRIANCTPLFTIAAAYNNQTAQQDQRAMMLGSIRSCFIFNRALTDQECVDIYDIGRIDIRRSPFNSGLEYGWNMDDGSGDECREVNGKQPLIIQNGAKWMRL